MLTEKKLIAQLQNAFPQYIGDDAAVIPCGEQSLVISKDILVEDVHFRRRYFTAHDLAIKALQVNCSDMAAMGVKPQYILSVISMPPECLQFMHFKI